MAWIDRLVVVLVEDLAGDQLLHGLVRPALLRPAFALASHTHPIEKRRPEFPLLELLKEGVAEEPVDLLHLRLVVPWRGGGPAGAAAAHGQERGFNVWVPLVQLERLELFFEGLELEIKRVEFLQMTAEEELHAGAAVRDFPLLVPAQKGQGHPGTGDERGDSYGHQIRI